MENVFSRCTTDKKVCAFEEMFLKNFEMLDARFFCKARNPLTEGRIMRFASQEKFIEEGKTCSAAYRLVNPKGLSGVALDFPLYLDSSMLVIQEGQEANGTYDFYIRNRYKNKAIYKVDVEKSVATQCMYAKLIPDAKKAEEIDLIYSKFDKLEIG